MNIEQLQQAIKEKFQSNGGTRIVFWYDGEKAFYESLNELNFDDVTVLNMENQAALEIKELLEIKDTIGSYLLYFPTGEPSYEDNWLLDIQLYSRVFTADRVSMVFNELGLNHISMKDHIAVRMAFCNSKQRLADLRKRLLPTDLEKDVDLKMMAVLAKSEQADLYNIIMAAAESHTGDIGGQSEFKAIEEICKFDLGEAFVNELQRSFGFEPSGECGSSQFYTFIRNLMLTGFCEGLEKTPEWAKPVIFKKGVGLSTARALLSRWRDSHKHYSTYDMLSAWAEKELELPNKLTEIDYKDLADIETFEAVEKYIIISIADELADTTSPEQRAELKELIRSRTTKHWATSSFSDNKRKTYCNTYNSLEAAIELFNLKDKYSEGFRYDNPKAFVHAYTEDLYLFDHWYRHYTLSEKPSGLRQLSESIENLYAGWFTDNLSSEWNRLIQNSDLINKWKISDVHNQYEFYNLHVKHVAGGTSNKRVAVIISDAFRYEASRELVQNITAEKGKYVVDTEYMIGVLPSYTALGMAALLPHKELSYKSDVPDDVFVDGSSSKGLVNRNKILERYNGKAFTYEDVVGWNKAAGRAEVKEYNILYIYHNRVDATGDKADSERDTFKAVEEAIKEIKGLIAKVFNNLNVSSVFVTADHGFLYQDSSPDDTNKTKLTEKPECMISKKRYLIGKNLPENSDVWHGKISATANSDCDTEFWVPRGANRFHFVSGARFVHGGTMPQEVIIPMIRIKSLRGDDAKAQEKKKVSVICQESLINMRNNIRTFKFIQADRVGGVFLPRTVKVGLYDEGQLISNAVRLVFDSDSDLIDSRTKEVRLSLLGSSFNKDKDYHLMITDVDADIEVNRYIVRINLAFDDDFFS